MAIDTAEKRRRALHIATRSTNIITPTPDGAIGAGDRAWVLWSYYDPIITGIIEFRLYDVTNSVEFEGTRGALNLDATQPSGASGSETRIITFTAGQIFKGQVRKNSVSGDVKTYPDGCRITIQKIS